MNWFLQNIYFILLGSAVLHMTEEFLYPGGFADEFKSFVKKLGLEINNYQILIINILFLSLVIFVVFFGNKYPLIGLSAVFLVMLNGAAHIFQTINLKRYFPGVITGTLLYLPAGVLALVYYDVEVSRKIIAMFIAAVFHLIPFLIIIFFRKNVKS